MLTRGVALLCVLLVAVFAISSAAQGLIVHGKVMMADGSPPPKIVGTVRICTDNLGTAPGPLTDKQGMFTWTLQNDRFNTRRCFIEATLAGYQSTQVEVSNLNAAVGLNVDLEPIILTLKGGDPYLLGGDEKDIPSKGKAEFTAAMNAVTAHDNAKALERLQAATAVNPKFALAWHDIGILLDFAHNYLEARAAYQKAIEIDPKLLTPYVALTRLMVNEKDWDGVNKTVAAFIPVDKDRMFGEMYLHRAVAQFNLKDLATAEASANEAMNPKGKQPVVRAEYTLGRILEAKGDMAGAKQHMSRYLTLVPNAPDAAMIKAHIEQIGQPGAPEPDFEIISR